MRHRRLVPPAVVLAAAVVAVGIWAAIGDVPFLTLPRSPMTAMQSYLDKDNASLRSLAKESHGVTDLQAAMSRYFRERDSDASHLWITQTGFGSEESRAAWEAGRMVTFVNFAPWSVPTDPSWAEDPYGNLSWQFYYQSLGWLQAPATAYHATHETTFARQVLHYVLSWIAGNPRRDAPSPRSWYDHAVAYRTDTIVATFPILAAVATPSELQTILRSLHQHGEELRSFLSDKRFIGHNHNLFHALSLYNLATAFPELKDAAQWKSDARRRISTLFGEMVNLDEGVSTEQASGYHLLALDLFAQADAYLSRHGDGLTSEERQVLAKMVEWSALLTRPDGTLPAMGDTAYRAQSEVATLKQRQAAGFATPWSRYVLSHGAEGARPPDAVFRPASGYAVMRPSYGEDGAWNDDLHLLVDMSDVLHSHGHRDAMNVLLYADGGPLLVDSGGPFVYGDSRHADFVATRAHNTVVVDDGDQGLGSVSITESLDSPAYSLVSGRHNLYPGVTHRREVLLLKPGVVVIADLLISDKSHAYTLLYHLPPAAQAVDGADWTRVSTATGASMALTVRGSAPMTAGIFRGDANTPNGWVTDAYLEEEPAPVLQYSVEARDAWFITVIAPGRADQLDAPAITWNETSASVELCLTSERGSWSVVVPKDGDVPVVRGLRRSQVQRLVP